MSAILPPQASAYAPRVDHIFLAILALSAVIVLLVLSLVIGFSIRYRNGSKAYRGPLPASVSREFEIGWTAASLFLGLFLFWWAGSSQLTQLFPPNDAVEIHVVAKQWMWTTQHPSGAREINAFHAPVGVPVKLVMTSQDVIHSFYVPAFRMKQDVLPGRYTETWFKATKPGTYHLFCAEYCGLDHARMTGEIVVMSKADYARWSSAQPQGDDLAHQGAVLFQSLGCAGCHVGSGAVRAPDLNGVYGREVPLAAGGFRTADEAYLRDSILQPRKDIVAGYEPIMPSFACIVSEDDLVPLIAYLKSLRSSGGERP
jgi:cytochrome c oxidase subunit 2